MMHGQKNANS